MDDNRAGGRALDQEDRGKWPYDSDRAECDGSPPMALTPLASWRTRGSYAGAKLAGSRWLR